MEDEVCDVWELNNTRRVIIKLRKNWWSCIVICLNRCSTTDASRQIRVSVEHKTIYPFSRDTTTSFTLFQRPSRNDDQSTAGPSTQQQQHSHNIAIEREAMSSSDIPSLLLQSTDARIAEAAKRVFSSHPIAPTAATTTSIATRPLTTSPPHYSHQGEQRNKTVSVAASTLTACASTESSKHTVMKKRPFDNSKPTTTTNNDDQFDLEEDKKLSSTERLQRR